MSERPQIDLLCPVKPYELDKQMRFGFNDLVQRVTTAAVLHNEGRDLMLYVYLAGLYHGVELQKERSK